MSSRRRAFRLRAITRNLAEGVAWTAGLVIVLMLLVAGLVTLIK